VIIMRQMLFAALWRHELGSGKQAGRRSRYYNRNARAMRAESPSK